MQISGSYSAVGALTGISSTQRTRREPQRRSAGSGDTVSISDEAKAAFRDAFGTNVGNLTEELAEAEMKFRQALEDAWNEENSNGASLMGRLQGLWRQLRY